MERAWDRFDFAVDVSDVYDLKMAALGAYESVFSGDPSTNLKIRVGGEQRCMPNTVAAAVTGYWKCRANSEAYWTPK